MAATTTRRTSIVITCFAVVVPLGSMVDGRPGQIAYVASLVAAAAIVLRSAIGARSAGRPRLLLGIGMGLWALGGALSTLKWSGPVPAIPDLAIDLLYVAGYVPALIGLADMSEPTRRVQRLGSIVDGLIVFALIYGVLWLTVVQPLATKADLPFAERAFSSVYPAGDLAMGMMVLNLWRRADIPRRVGRLLCGGVVLSAAADTALLWLYLQFPDGSWGFTDLLYLTGTAMIAVAAMLGPHTVPTAHSERWPTMGLRPRLVGCSLAVPAAVVGAAQIMHREVRLTPIAVWLLVLGLLAGLRVTCYVRTVESAARELDWRGSHDVMTGMLSMRAFTELATSGGHRERSGALLHIDIDGFRMIRQEHGQLVAEQVVTTVSHRMHSSLPDDAVLGRLGLDEFVVFLRSADGSRARAVAEATQHDITHPIELGTLTIEVSVSVGVAQIDGTVIDLAAGMRRCQQAVRHAKSLGPGHLLVDADLAGQFEPDLIRHPAAPAPPPVRPSAITPPLAVGALSSNGVGRPPVASGH